MRYVVAILLPAVSGPITLHLTESYTAVFAVGALISRLILDVARALDGEYS